MVASHDDWDKPRGYRGFLSPAQIASIREACRLERNRKDVARELQCASRTVDKYYRHFRAEGIGDMAKFWTPSKNEALTTLWYTGDSYADIAEELGCTPGAVRSHAGHLGLPRRAHNNEPLPETKNYETASQAVVRQDEAFQAAMLEAATIGKERPPMLSVNTKPGTRAPSSIPSGDRPNAGVTSSAGQCVDF